MSSETEYIIIRGARQHNLKNIDINIPRNRPCGHYRHLRIRQIHIGV